MTKKKRTFILLLLLTILLAMPMAGCGKKGKEEKDEETGPQEPAEPPVSFSMTVSENNGDTIDVDILHFDSEGKTDQVVDHQANWQEYPMMVYGPERQETYIMMSDSSRGIMISAKGQEDKDKEEEKEEKDKNDDKQSRRICQGMNVRYIFPAGDKLYLVGSKDMIYDKPWLYDLKEDSLKAISWPDQLSVSSAAFSAIDGNFYIAGYSVEDQKKADKDNPNPLDQPYAVDNHMYVYNGREMKKIFTEKGRNIDEIAGNTDKLIYVTSLIGMGENDKKTIKIYDMKKDEFTDMPEDASNLINGQIVHLTRKGDLLYVNEYTKFSCVDLEAKTTEALFSVSNNSYINHVQACFDSKSVKEFLDYLKALDSQEKEDAEDKKDSQDSEKGKSDSQTQEEGEN